MEQHTFSYLLIVNFFNTLYFILLMQSQMNLTLFIGDVLVGVIVLVIGLILAWSVLSSTADACKLAVGVGSDVVSLVQAEYSIPGEITFDYKGPSICRVGESPLLKCSPAKGWNPNITSIEVHPLYFSGTYGFDSQVPVALDANIHIEWMQDEEEKQSSLDVLGLYTYSYSLSPLIKLVAESNKNTIQIHKGISVFGDGDGQLYDPLGSKSDGLANVVIQLHKSCKDNEPIINLKSYPLPSGYQLAWNDTHICLYQLVLNSGFKQFDNLNFISSFKKGYSYELRRHFGFAYYVTNYTKDNSAIIFSKWGKNITLVKYYPTKDDDGTYIDSDFDDDTQFYECTSITYDNSTDKYVCTTTGSEITNPKMIVYDPYDQSNVDVYNTGWKKLRCIDFSELGNKLGIDNYHYEFDVAKGIYYFKASDNMNHVILNFNNYNDITIWKFNVTYLCSDNTTKITLLGVNS